MIKQVTFTSDFGYVDPYVGEVKGIITACEPEARIFDITHAIEPGNLSAASFVLLSACRYFRKDTVHLAVIDPGVGTGRDIIVVTTRRYVLIGPDNGILYEAVNEDGGGKIYALDRERFFKKLEKIYVDNEVIHRIIRGGVSPTFHGRDLFAPLTGYILGNHPIQEVAREKDSWVKLEIMRPVEDENKIMGRVIYIDRFGNLITNVKADLVAPDSEVYLKTKDRLTSIGTRKKTYSSVEADSFLPLIGSMGFLEIAVNRGSAKDYFNARYGDEILILKKVVEG